MLAQSFMSAADLGLFEVERDALIKTLHAMDRGELKHDPNPDILDIEGTIFTGTFNMFWWNKQSICGTVCCIGGTANLLGHLGIDHGWPEGMDCLFRPFDGEHSYLIGITVPQAANALRNYLVTGNPQWAEVLKAERAEVL